MNKEESIQKIQDQIEKVKEYIEYGMPYGEYLQLQLAFEDIVNLIEKQSKEIEELKDRNKKLQDKAKELIFEKQELTSALLDSTPNDKIKAKIEPKLKELDKQINEEWKKYGNSKELQDMEDIYNFLQSLLEKE